MTAEEPTGPGSYVKITRVGRWLHEVNIVTRTAVIVPSGSERLISMERQSPWLALGRWHAERLGARKLRQHLRREAWRAE